MSIRKPEPKAAVSILRSAFAQAHAAGGDFTVKAAYDLLAHLDGYKNWAHAKSMAPAKASSNKPAPGRLTAEIAAWPTYVVFADEANDEGTIYVMPKGATLESRRAPRGSYEQFEEAGSKCMPYAMFEGAEGAVAIEALRLSSVVVKNVFSSVPRTDRYGIPDFAHERLVHHWSVSEMGWGFLAMANRADPAVEVDFVDTGDDSMPRWWAEVAIEPALAARMDALMAEDLEVL